MQNNFTLPTQVQKKLINIHQQGRCLVLATGVFDLLHQEHILFLKKAKAEGDVLVVALESDGRVKALKGQNRPINNQTLRLANIKKLTVVDLAFILPEKFASQTDHQNLLKLVKPDVLAVSSHTPFIDQKRKLMRQIGARVKVVHKHNPQVSTSILINNKTKRV